MLRLLQSGLWLAGMACGMPRTMYTFIEPQDSNSLEAMNKVLKSSNYFNSVEGLGTVHTEFPRLLTRFSDNARVS